ncbi:unnamed protein product [Meganyctiphanes norvegica]|uniref:Uncharacterized protein n=1 Tax=Meganyctiphanes norvegica TaxID=48144 RepID=A0AAV2SDC5_MEGNR
MHFSANVYNFIANILLLTIFWKKIISLYFLPVACTSDFFFFFFMIFFLSFRNIIKWSNVSEKIPKNHFWIFKFNFGEIITQIITQMLQVKLNKLESLLRAFH